MFTGGSSAAHTHTCMKHTHTLHLIASVCFREFTLTVQWLTEDTPAHPVFTSPVCDLWGSLLCVQEYPVTPSPESRRLSGAYYLTSSCSAASKARCRTAAPPSTGTGAWEARWRWPSEPGLALTSGPGSFWAEGRPGRKETSRCYWC